METASTKVTSIWRQNNVREKISAWRTWRYYVDFESRIHVEISSLNRCHNVHVDSPFKIDVISTNFPREISTSNWRRFDEDVSIGKWVYKKDILIRLNVCILWWKIEIYDKYMIIWEEVNSIIRKHLIVNLYIIKNI